MKEKFTCNASVLTRYLSSSWLHLCAIIGIVLAIYAQSITFDFTYFDDDVILLQNESFFTTNCSVKTIFTTNASISNESALYRPLQNLSFAFDAYIAGALVPWIFHLTNLMLFMLIGISLYGFLLKFEIIKCYALLGSLLLLVNPLNVWSVVWIPARGDLLLTLFTILSFSCFINFLKTNKFINLFLTFLCFSLALFAKENAVFIPLLFLFYFIYQKSKINYKHILLAGLMIGTGIVWFYFRYQATSFNYAVSLHNVVYNFQNIPVALSQIVFPYEMSPFPTFSLTKIVLGSMILVVLLFLVIKKTEILRMEKIFFLLWFLFFLFPTFFFKFKDIDYLEHRYLIPQIGILMIVLKMLQVTSSKPRATHYRIQFPFTSRQLPHTAYLIFIFIFIFGITSFIKARTLQNPVTIAEAVEKHKGAAAIPYTNRGLYHIDKGIYYEAIKDYQKVLLLDPEDNVSINNLARLYMLLKKYEDAITYYSISILLNNKMDDGAYYNRALAKTYLGNFESALSDMDSAIMLNHSDPVLFNARGVLKVNLKYTEEALSDFDEAVRLSNSLYSDALGNRAFARFMAEDITGALQDCLQALQFEPKNVKLAMLRDNILNTKN